MRTPERRVGASNVRGPFCSHDCLSEMVYNKRSSTENICPNQIAHGKRKSTPKLPLEFLASHLATNAGRKLCLTPLGQSGRSGVLYMVRIPESGHRLVAKGFRHEDLRWLENEEAVYARLRSLQGQYVPVYCGVIHLTAPLKATGDRTIQHLLLLSWAGESLNDQRLELERSTSSLSFLKPKLLSGLQRIHQEQVVHGDTERRNMVFDKFSQCLMMVDFERSRLYTNRSPCTPTAPCQKPRRDKKGRKTLCMYCRELAVAEDALLVGSPQTTPDITPNSIVSPKVDPHGSFLLDETSCLSKAVRMKAKDLGLEEPRHYSSATWPAERGSRRKKRRKTANGLAEIQTERSVWTGRLRGRGTQ